MAPGGEALRRAHRRWRSRLLQRRIADGLEPQGWFIPYRYWRAVPPDGGYPNLRSTFDAALPEMRQVLEWIRAERSSFERFGGPAPSPRFAQDWFPGLDLTAAYAMVRMRQPRSIVEIGSGHSTRVLARAVADGGFACRILAIDPAPRARLRGLDVVWERRLLQRSDGELVADLEPGDILFVDSSHVLMPGSDVDLVLNHLLPRLRPGVLVHIHDILLPDAYPASWQWRGYNEQAAVAPLLQSGWAIRFASAYLRRWCPENLSAFGLDWVERPEGALETSLWLERTLKS